MFKKSYITNMGYNMFNRNNINYIIIGLLSIILILLTIGNYNLTITEGYSGFINNFDVEMIDQNDNLRVTANKLNNINNTANNQKEEKKKQSDEFANKAYINENSLIGGNSDGNKPKGCSSNYSNPYSNKDIDLNYMFNSICENKQTLTHANKSLLNKETSV